MKTRELSRWLLGLCLTATVVLAQQGPPPEGGRGGRGGREGRGNWDPAQMQERMMTRFQESLKATPEEWTVIEPLLKGVLDKQRAARDLSGMRGMFRAGPQGGPQGGPEQPAEVAALEKALEGTDAEAVKTALAALRTARAAREAELTKAKEALREVLSVPQEARMVLMGILE